MYCRELGDKKNPSLVFLHSAGFVDVFHELYSMQYDRHITVPHINGNGEEIKSEFKASSVALDLNCFIQGLGKDKVSIVGYRLGAELIIPILCKSPQIVSRVVLIEPDFIKKPDTISRNIKSYLSDPFKKDRTIQRIRGMYNGLKGGMLDDYVESASNMNAVNMIEMLKGVDIGGYDISRIDTPMLAIYGEHEKAEYVATANLLEDRCIHCTTQLLKGRHLPLKRAEALKSIISEFLV